MQQEPSLREQLEHYLRMVSQIEERCHMVGVHRFVLKEGRFFEPAKLPRSIPQGVKQECFRNAALLTLERPELTYCEGYGLAIIPTMHAWCIDKKGRVVDPTWDRPERCEYFGIPMKTEYLRKTLLSVAKVWGLLGAPETALALIEAPRSLYHAEEVA